MDGTPSTDEDRLTAYRRRRDFERTAEPSGVATGGRGNRFVVQFHRARRQHFDLRLEVAGALASWAVPKGPTLDPSARRLAVHVEDHPVEYADFEGIIPEGEYGAGDVIVWDQGSWSPVDTDDPASAIADGSLHFDLFGEKLVGRFVLVRRSTDDSGKEQWLLLHKKDQHGQPGWTVERQPRSVMTGRTSEEVAEQAGPVWRGAADQSENPAWRSPTEDELAALDALGAEGMWSVCGRELKLTNLDKVLFPGTDAEPAVTKRDLIRYHACIGPVMLPYLVDRPLNTQRFPGGTDRPGFWQKEVPAHAPDWLRSWRFDEAKSGETRWYVVPDSTPALVWLANYAAVELHPWISRTDDIHHPTWALFDIDPGEATSFDDVLALARLHRTALGHLGVDGRPKVSGQGGVQIWVPVEPRYTFAETREWVKNVSQAIGDAMPDLVSWAWRKSERQGRARLDYTQNVLHKTLVAPYSARPRPGAPVSVPIEWDELDDPDLAPDRWSVRSVLNRVATAGDPFAPLLSVRQPLPHL